MAAKKALMQSRRLGLVRLSQLRRQKRVQTAMTFGLAVLGPLLALATLAVLGPMDRGGESDWLRLILLLDLVYLIALAGLVSVRMVRMVTARRRSQAGSRLHLRLASIFTGIALVPTVLVALFAGLTLSIGLEGWFSSRVQQVVDNSLAAAEAYQDEHHRDLTADARALANYLITATQAEPFIDDGSLRQFLVQGQGLIQRGLREAYIVDQSGELRARGDRSYLFWYEKPAPENYKTAREDGIALIEDWQNSEFRALVPLTPLIDRYLYVTRDVDGSLLGLLDGTRETVSTYQRLEATRGKVLFEFSLLYLGFALLLVGAATWAGLWFAERLSRPIGRLAEAAVSVGEGNLDIQLPNPSTRDEIETLSLAFNRMTKKLKSQHVELVESYQIAEARRRLFDSVLSSITAGVIGLDADGEIDFVNRAATRLLGLTEADHDRPLAEAVPEFAPLFERLVTGVAETVQEEVRVTHSGRIESLLTRMAVRLGDSGGLEGFVVAFDDVTDLVSAQRMAAWGDVARRVAHEIKNPLTPIQLSAERVRRKFGKMITDEADRDALEQYTEVIIRQTNDLRRIVDEFSKFARMPEAHREDSDLAGLMREVLLMQKEVIGDALVSNIPDQPVMVAADAGLIRQALVNLLKNAGESVAEYAADAPDGWTPQVTADMTLQDNRLVIRIGDNGGGLPQDRSRLFEPYITMKSGGTGLGLAIVKKIIEEHGGTLTLGDNAPRGAMAEIRLPCEATSPSNEQNQQAEP